VAILAELVAARNGLVLSRMTGSADSRAA